MKDEAEAAAVREVGKRFPSLSLSMELVKDEEEETAQSLLALFHKKQDKYDNYLVLSSDSIVPESAIKSLLEAHFINKSAASMLLAKKTQVYFFSFLIFYSFFLSLVYSFYYFILFCFVY